MKFKISRASDWDAENAPVPGAWSEVREVTETRPWGSFGKRAGELWDKFQNEGGRNHRKVERHSTSIKGEPTTLVDYEREEDCREWFIEVATLEDLIALQQAVGHGLIINDNAEDRGLTILIHDDYIE